MVTIEIGARLLDKRKSIPNLRPVLRQLCSEWKIDYSRVRGVVTDGGANIKGAVKEEFGEDKHISCVAHKINTIGQKVIGLYESNKPGSSDPAREEPPSDLPENESDIDDEVYTEEEPEDSIHTTLPRARADLRKLLRKLKRIIQFFRQSEVATCALMAEQITESGKEGLKLIQEVRTQWHSCFAMIER